METFAHQSTAPQVVVMTPAQLRELVQSAICEVLTSTDGKDASPSPRYVFGLRGIAELFGVTVPTAQEYKNTWLQPAVMQRGHKIITDANKAIELFNERKK